MSLTVERKEFEGSCMEVEEHDSLANLKKILKNLVESKVLLFPHRHINSSSLVDNMLSQLQSLSVDLVDMSVSLNYINSLKLVMYPESLPDVLRDLINLYKMKETVFLSAEMLQHVNMCGNLHSFIKFLFVQDENKVGLTERDRKELSLQTELLGLKDLTSALRATLSPEDTFKRRVTYVSGRVSSYECKSKYKKQDDDNILKSVEMTLEEYMKSKDLELQDSGLEELSRELQLLLGSNIEYEDDLSSVKSFMAFLKSGFIVNPVMIVEKLFSFRSMDRVEISNLLSILGFEMLASVLRESITI